MIRLGAIFWLVVVGVTGFATFKVKHVVQELEDELSRTRKATFAEQQELRVLNAEWSYLNQPARLAEMNRRYLSLTPIATRQLGRGIAEIPMRPPPPAAPAEPDRVEPARVETAAAEPAGPERALAEPALAERALAEPAAPEPAAAAPIPSPTATDTAIAASPTTAASPALPAPGPRLPARPESARPENPRPETARADAARPEPVRAVMKPQAAPARAPRTIDDLLTQIAASRR